MSKKEDFNLDNFEFQIIKLELYSNKKNENITKAIFYLLIDEKNFIHDFKVQFESLNITTITTKSHQNNLKIGNKVEWRKKFVNLCGKEHQFSEKNIEQNKTYYKIDHKTIEEINKEIWKWNFFVDIRTFREIEYLIIGSNPSGQGVSNSSFFKTKDDKKVGFLLKNLYYWTYNNFKKVLNSPNVYDDIWNHIKPNNEFVNNHNSIIINDFETWLKNQKNINNLLNEFNKNSKNWKTISKTFKETIKDERIKWKQLDKKINNLRSEQKKNILQKYKNEIIEKENYCKEFFENGEPFSDWEHAHIKRVSLIKKEYLTKNNKEILKEIADPDNFLPLTPNIHKFFDNNKIYWDCDGKLKILNEKIKYNKELNQVDKIKEIYLKPRLKYIKEYIKRLSN